MFSKKAGSALFLGVLLLVTPVLAQRTSVPAGWNAFSTEQDVEMGRALSTDLSLDWSRDSFAHGYINALGSQLAEHAPGYRYPFEFRIFNDPSIKSLALPGGIIYVSSGLVLAAQNEPQLAGVLAHQIGHVVARHGTRQVSSAYTSRTNPGRSNVSVPDVISRLNLRAEHGSILLKSTTQAEQEADTIAAQMLFDARFDPQVLTAGMQRIVNQPRNLTQEFSKDHPTLVNRAALVRRETQRLGRLPANLRGDSPDLLTTQRNLRDEAPYASDRISANRPQQLPANRFVIYQGYDVEIRHPENWLVSENGTTVTIAPEHGSVDGSLAYGMLIDTFVPRGRENFGQNSFSIPGQAGQRLTTLSVATDQLVADLRRTNPDLRVIRSVQKPVAGQAGLEVEMSNTSPTGGREVNRLTTVLRNDVLYYFLAVAPQADINGSTPIFERMISSVRFYN